ncbi:AurF N-oxygenase family protein [Actinomadura sp. WAC 06369]|uniref:AurF N-oxygenase family protein n=1 Tax=Actinomadura sp. WAC 06369 TaxID=2203193 RepID=UPI000F7875FE|nr:diiron oxygenase [Actinomadura sp. WAC 06369]RSN69938.1 diiron oxygenase [Actinomadura sp. WAC 06369]
MPPEALVQQDRARNRTARIRCRDGDHTLELTDREVVAERLLRTSRKHSFDPEADVDWDAPQDPDVFYMPPQLVSLYETPLWDAMSHRRRVELSKHEVCSIASFGIWSEMLLMQSLVMHAYRKRYDSEHVAYALTEIADECRHSTMFARMVRTCGLRTHRPRAVEFQAAKLLGVVYDPMPMFAGTLVVEEFTDAFQRLTFPDEDVQPMVRQVTRIHVIEEARHIKYAREELKRLVARAAPARRRAAAYGLARATRFMASQVIHPSCYEAVGLDPKAAKRAAARSAHRRATLTWAFRKCTGFLDEVGFLDGRARGVWERAGLLAPITGTR